MASSIILSETEQITTSLVREFLSRKGLINTLATLDEESPRTDFSISNRVQLAKAIGVEKLMRKNKESESPYRTILEVITANYVNKVKTKTDDMYLRTKEDVKGKSQQCAANEELVLEDTEEGETLLGDGNVGNQRPDSSGPIITNPRGRCHSHGSVTSNLNERDQRKIKRIFNNPRNLFDGDSNRTEIKYESTTNDRNEVKYRRSLSEVKYESTDKSDRFENNSTPFKVESVQAVKKLQKVNSLPEFNGDLKAERKKIDVRKVFEETNQEPLKSEAKTTFKERTEPKKPKNRAELLKMLDMEDPNTIGPNAYRNVPEKPLLEKDDSSKPDDVEQKHQDDSAPEVAEVIEPAIPKLAASTTRESFPIDLKTAQNLKIVIFGTTLQQFYDEWKLQAFTFTNHDEVKYGFVQKKVGPCGVLAAVQACCLQDLLFGAFKDPTRRKLSPMRYERTEALSTGISTLLWRCGGQNSAVVALPSDKSYFCGSNKFKADGLTETLMLTKFDDFTDLCKFVLENISHFETDNSPGVILLLYSAILSRGSENVKSDMDDKKGKLMGQDSYCTQEMVNLLLTGRAASNTFNGKTERRASDHATILTGLTTRSDIGFLSLFEHLGSCQVGTYYKTPKYPIWLVRCGNHFSVVFSLKKELISDWKAERRFDLFFYDSLARQYDEIKLTVDTTNRFYEPPADEDMVPPLENCIRTKWPEAAIDWNGTEPLL